MDSQNYQGEKMGEKVTIEIIKGEAAGRKYEYVEADRMFVGRQEDCGIVLPENTVSRYHCLLDINPPLIKLQDFGSLNGTFLNGRKIGQREREQSREEAGGEAHEEYELHDGDVIRLGKRCELKCTIEKADILAISGEWDESQQGRDVEEVEEPEDGNVYASAMEGGSAEEVPAEESEGLPLEEEAELAEEASAEEASAEEASAEEASAEEAEPAVESAEESLEEEAVAAEAPAEEEPEAAAEEAPAEAAGEEPAAEEPEEEEDEADAEHNKVMEQALANLLIEILGGLKMEQPAGPAPVEGFDKVALLGKGGMGEVWKVKERKTGKVYALKTMLPELAGDRKAKDMFLREAKLTEFLDHENVVRTYKTGFSNKVYYIMMDLCEGGSVDSLMEHYGGKLPLNLATFIILQALDGLDYVHNAPVQAQIIKKGLFGGEKEKSMDAKGLVHRDFKPGNIFLADNSDHPVAKVADFGMAKAFQAAGLSNISDVPGMVKGTVPFMPRQQALNCRYAKPEVDIWAAAATYYHMLTGQFPKNFRRGANMWQIVVSENAVPIRQRDPSIPVKLAEVIDRALIERPKIVYSSAAVLHDDIVRALPEGTRNYCMDIL